MTHLDEGTIHAWLDGALTAEEARHCEQHAAQCESCRTMVAEARGLIAGASRILSALDDAPSGVVPTGGPRRKVLRRWTLGIGWALAATLVVAVGIGYVGGSATRRSMPTVSSVAPPIGQKAPPAPAAAQSPKAAGKIAAASQPRVAKAPIEAQSTTADAAKAIDAVREQQAATRMDTMHSGPVRPVVPTCYTNGAATLVLDTTAVEADLPQWRLLRDNGQVVGRWSVGPSDSLTLIIEQPMQRMLRGVMRPVGLDLREPSSGAMVWMGRTACNGTNG
jgi:Putative zinc-finger